MKKYNLENRFDLLTGEILECKSPESYHLQNFKDKRNMKKYFLNAIENKTPEVIQEFIFNTYKGYIELKGLQYIPHFVETMTIKVLPHAITVDQYYDGGYSKLIKDLNAASFLKYDNINFPDISNLDPNIRIVQDTREKTPPKISYPIDIHKLDYGDYTIDRPNQTVFIERKAAGDFLSSVSSNASFERFCREMERARNANKYIVILVENKFESVFYAQNFFVRKASPDFIMHRLRDLCRKFPKNLQVLFVDGRKEAAKMIPYLLYFDKEIMDIDLQFAYNKGLIKCG